MSVIVIGIDPGLTGALAFFAGGTLKDVVDVPTDVRTLARKGGTIRDLIGGKKEVTRRSVNASAMAQVIRDWTSGHSALVFKEKMSTRPSQNSSQLMKADGVLIGVIGALGIELREIEPASWKLALGVTADKETARELAIELFPAWRHMFKRKMDHNRAEAALIGLFGVRNAAP